MESREGRDTVTPKKAPKQLLSQNPRSDAHGTRVHGRFALFAVVTL